MKMTKIFAAVMAALVLVSSPMAMSVVRAYDMSEILPTPNPKPKPKPKPTPKPKPKPKPQYSYTLVNWDFQNLKITWLNNLDGTKQELYFEQLPDGGIRLNDDVLDNTTFVVPHGCTAHCNPAKHESLDKPGITRLNAEGYQFIVFSEGTTVRCNNGKGPVFTLFGWQ